MKINPILLTTGIVMAILGLAVIGILLYFTLGIREGSTANPGGIIAAATLLWASVKTRILNFKGRNIFASLGLSPATPAPVASPEESTVPAQQQQGREEEQGKAARRERERQRAAKIEQARLRVRKGIALYDLELIDRDTVERAMADKSYEIYDRTIAVAGQPVASNGINIVGIRNNNAKPNSFDDAIVVFWKPEDSQAWEFRRYKATTDPGISFLGTEEMGDANGTAILKEDQYRDSYQIGKHKGKYTALTQAAPMTVIRDKDKDELLSFGSNNFYEGMFGINIHRSSKTDESTQVDNWSAGCQVFAKAAEWNEFIELCQKAKEKYGQRFTYTLLNVEDVIQAVA